MGFLLLGGSSAVAQVPLAPRDLERWKAEVEVRIGSLDDPDYALELPYVLLGPDDMVYVIEQRAGKVRVFARDGQFSHGFARRGRGPGELTSPATAGFTGDTLWIFDARDRRITLFSLDGAYLEDYRFEVARTDVRQPVMPVRILDGRLHVAIMDPARRTREPPAERFVRTTVLVDRHGEIIEVLDSVPVTLPGIYYGQGSVVLYQPIRDDRLTVSAGDDAGSIVIDRTAPTRRADGLLRMYRLAADGDTLQERRLRYAPQELPAARRDSLLQAALDRQPGPGVNRERDRAIRDQLFLPRFLPPVTAARRSSDGLLWLRRELLTVERPYWVILDEHLRPRARVSFPIEPERILRIQGNEVWAIERDELDVPYIVRYRLTREGASSRTWPGTG
jgi:hypothetical protein